MPLQLGNSKLGLLVWSWSLLAGQCCPGKTKLCHRLCYARRGRFVFRDVRNSYARNKSVADSADFVSWICGEIRRLAVRAVRVHASGDFDSEAYASKWLQIVRRNRQTMFYAYTRSWRVPEILPVLKLLAKEPNVLLWFSCDRETGRPPAVGRVRRAWMAEHDLDPPPYTVDLVFRNADKKVMKWMGGALVCPTDNGVTKLTCSQCKLCFSARKVPHAKEQKEALGAAKQKATGRRVREEGAQATGRRAREEEAQADREAASRAVPAGT